VARSCGCEPSKKRTRPFPFGTDVGVRFLHLIPVVVWS
jgi:hypothetical protein